MEKDTAPYLRWGGYIPRPPTRLISNWRAKTSRIRLHKERRITVQDSFMIVRLEEGETGSPAMAMLTKGICLRNSNRSRANCVKKSKLPRPS